METSDGVDRGRQRGIGISNSIGNVKFPQASIEIGQIVRIFQFRVIVKYQITPSKNPLRQKCNQSSQSFFFQIPTKCCLKVESTCFQVGGLYRNRKKLDSLSNTQLCKRLEEFCPLENCLICGIFYPMHFRFRNTVLPSCYISCLVTQSQFMLSNIGHVYLKMTLLGSKT